MAVRFQLRRDTAANWASANSVLALGEPGVETDTLKVKVGDGSTAWNSLGYSITKDFADLTNTPTTLAAYGITDALSLAQLSVTQNSASGTGALSYNNATGVFEYTPPDFAGLTGDFTGSVFADDSTLLVDGVNATLNLANNSTTDLSEGTNLYYTDVRADARIAAAGITDLSDADQTVQTTDDVTFNSVTGNVITSQIDSADSSAIEIQTDVEMLAGLTVGNHIVPSSSENIDLGSASARFRDLYLSGNSAVIGDLALKRHTGGGLLVSDHSTGNPTNVTTHNITANDITAAGDVDVTGNLTMTGYIAGPATMTIDPAAVGDNTGTLVVAGNLQVDGTTTTINSQTLEVEDKNVVLGPNAANDAANNGAGITVTQPDTTDATLIYNTTDTQWELNKKLDIAGKVTSTDIDILSNNPRIRLDDSDTDNNAEVTLDNTSLRIEVDEDDAIADSLIKFRVDADTKAVITSTGRLGIGYESPSNNIHILGSDASPNVGITLQSDDTANATATLTLMARDASNVNQAVNIQNTLGRLNIDANMDVIGVGTNFKSASYNILNLQTDTDDNGSSDDGIFKITNGSAGTTKAEFRWDESEDLVHVSYGDHGRHISINSSGNVGIGTSSTDPDLKLHVDGANGYPASSGTTPVGHIAIRAKSNSSSHGANIGVADASPWGTWIQAQDANNLATSYPLLLNPNGGNVGIGTTNPTHRLQVNGTAADGTELLHISSDGDVADGGYHWMTSAIAGSQTTNANIIHMIGKELASKNSGYFGFHYAGDHSDDNFITLGGYAADQLLNIKMNGNVGIGTASPQHDLVIHNDSGPFISLIGDGYNDEMGIIFNGGDQINISSAGNTGAKITSQLAVNGGQVLGDLRFITNSGDTFVDSMYIDTDGNVGIGNTDPSSKLEVGNGTSTYLTLRNASTGDISSGYNIMSGSTTTTSLYGNAGEGWTTLLSGGSLNFRVNNAVSGFNPLGIATDGTVNFTKVMKLDGNDAYYICTASNGYRFNNSTDAFNNVIFAENGNVTIRGALSKGSGSFRIPHPVESKTATHDLVHSFLEAPQADNLYRGKVDLVAGSATVNIDTVAGMTEGTFAALNREVQCFTSNETGWTAVKGSVSGNTLTIIAQDNSCTDTISWMVVGERKDQHMYDTDWTDDNGKVIVEPTKRPDKI